MDVENVNIIAKQTNTELSAISYFQDGSQLNIVTNKMAILDQEGHRLSKESWHEEDQTEAEMMDHLSEEGVGGHFVSGH